MAHKANPGYHKRDMAVGAVLGAVGAGLFSAGTIGGSSMVYADEEYDLFSAELFSLAWVLAATGTGFAIAGNVTLMASALGASLDLSGDAAAVRRLRSRPRFVAAPLLAPLKEGAVFGVSGLF